MSCDVLADYGPCGTTYTVQRKGDTCARISQETGWPLLLIRHLNVDLNCSNLLIGDEVCLFVREYCSKGYVVKEGDTCDSVTADFKLWQGFLAHYNEWTRLRMVWTPDGTVCYGPPLVPHKQVLCVGGIFRGT